jgi:hypothetical protein
MAFSVMAGGVYAVKYGNSGRDSASLAKPYAIRLVKKTGSAKLHTEKVTWELVGAKQTPRTRTSGSMLVTTFLRVALRQLTPEQADAVAAGSRVPADG